MTETSAIESESNEPRSIVERLGALGAVGLLSAFTMLFVVGALILVAEAVGPSTTEQGRVLVRTDASYERTTCILGTGPARSTGCRTFEVPNGAVGGEFPDGETWVVVAQSAYENAPTPGTDVDVTTSSLTNRVIAFDGPRSFDDSWSLRSSGEFIVFVTFGVIMGVIIAALVVLTRRSDRSFPAPRGAGLAVGAVGGIVGLFGMYVLLFGNSEYEPLSSEQLYGGADVIADPFAFAGSEAEAHDAGRVVDSPIGSPVPFTARVVAPDELGDIVTRIDAGLTPVVVVAEGLLRAPLALTVRAETPDGERMDSVPCNPDIEEFPLPVSADQSIVAGVFCLPAPPANDTVFIGDNPINDRATPARLVGEPAD